MCVSCAFASEKWIGLLEIPFFDPLQTTELGSVGTVAPDICFYGSTVSKPCTPTVKGLCLPPTRD